MQIVSSMPTEERGDDVLSDQLEKNIMHVMEMGERARCVSTTCRILFRCNSIGGIICLAVPSRGR